jgi:hypothetical protein
MYVETRTTLNEGLRDMFAEVNAKANEVVNMIDTHKAHPTYLNKSDIGRRYHELHGMHQLAVAVAGDYRLFPDDLRIKIESVHAAVVAYGVKL